MRLCTALLVVLVPAVAMSAPKKRPKKTDKAGKVDKSKTTRPDKPAEPVEPPAEPADADAGGGAPAPAPATPQTPAAATTDPPADAAADKPAGDAVDVDTLRQEYLSLRDELFKSRARASAVASQLYSTRIQIKLTYTSARYYSPAKATIRLDGASVFENATGAIGGDDGIRFDGYVAPGKHLVTFRVEATGKDDDTFTSVSESQIVVKAVAGKDLVVAGRARDSGDIAYEWKRKERGSYGLGLDVSVKAIPRDTGKAKK